MFYPLCNILIGMEYSDLCCLKYFVLKLNHISYIACIDIFCIGVGFICLLTLNSSCVAMYVCSLVYILT